MKLVKATITNYRSILNAYNITISNFTVLVGPNNEGKSNILKAINLALDILANWRITKRLILGSGGLRRTKLPSGKVDYNWERDFPINLQSKKPEGKSVITLELELNPIEIQDFVRQTGINLNTNLRIQLKFGQSEISYDILMKGKGKKTLNSKREEIASFIQKRIVYQYISAIRPSQYAKSIIERVLNNDLEKLEDDPEYQEALEKIKNIQKPIFKNVSDKILDTMRVFIPNVRSIHVTKEENGRRFIPHKDCNIFIDDGTNTELEMKGDGIVSLSAISLVRHFSNDVSDTKNLIFAIEEPESHLHPDGITQLKSILSSIAKESQVIITTHSPILVDRKVIDNNVLVKTGKAQKAKKISQIRKALGIKLSDNLTNAQLVLLVEGYSDKKILDSLLKEKSSDLGEAMNEGVMIVDYTRGASKLPHHSQFYKQNLANVHVYFDHDDEGRKSIDECLNKSIILDNEYTLITCKGMTNSEIEDLFDSGVYMDKVVAKFGLSSTRGRKKGSTKWTDRMRDIFLTNGKRWTSQVEDRLKEYVADCIIDKGISSLNDHKRSSFDALVNRLEERIIELSEK